MHSQGKRDRIERAVGRGTRHLVVLRAQLEQPTARVSDLFIRAVLFECLDDACERRAPDLVARGARREEAREARE